MVKEKIIVNGYALDEQQLKTVIENEKYSLIIAGAGSGKSLTLIGKIKYLLENNIYKPEEICCISFTNEATNSLSNNIIKNTGLEVKTLTFHKLALTILRNENIEFNITSTMLLDDVIDEFFRNDCYGNSNLKDIIFNIFHVRIFKSKKNWSKLMSSKDLLSLKKTIKTFICLMKSNGYNKDNFNEFFKYKRFKKMLVLIYTIYVIYESEKSSDNSIDFDDMMSYARKVIIDSGCNLPYKLVIIDEFQDTSLCRFELIREIIKQNDASLCVVGDDYQSIYHFSGCDLNLFLNFNQFYPSAKIYKLEKTYRNSVELIETSSKFIMKNPMQVKKSLTSPKRLDNPIIICYYKNVDKILEKVINEIPDDKEILIISRNNFDIKKYTRELEYEVIENNYLKFSKFKNRKIRFLTIHSSKGLESDIVIVLNMEDSLFGMPSKMKDEKILSLVKKRQPYPFEEERRLFYVALTRTKSYVYLLAPLVSSSCFVKEIEKEKNVRVAKY